MEKILPLSPVHCAAQLGQAQEDGGGEGVETIEKLQNLEPATNAGPRLAKRNRKRSFTSYRCATISCRRSLYVIRRGVKEAMEAEADCLIIDMETNAAAKVDITEEIFGIIDKFKGETVTYVNRDAYSPGHSSPSRPIKFTWPHRA